MGKRRTGVTVRDINRWLKQGFGSGVEGSYKPWLRVSDVPSKGRSRRVRGLKSGRVHHLLSDLEYAIFLMAEYSTLIVDIREQFPLLPYGSTEVIAAEMGVRHSVYPESVTPVLMSHDFVLTMSEKAADRTPLAISAKYQWDDTAKNKRMLEKLEIERRFASKVGRMHWKLITDAHFDPMIVSNLDWLHYGMRHDLPKEYRQIAPYLLPLLRSLDYQERRLSAVLTDLEKIPDLRGLSPSIAFKVAAWAGHLPLDLALEIRPRTIVKEMQPTRAVAELPHVA